MQRNVLSRRAKGVDVPQRWIPLSLEMRARFLSFHAGDFMHALHCTKFQAKRLSLSAKNKIT